MIIKIIVLVTMIAMKMIVGNMMITAITGDKDNDNRKVMIQVIMKEHHPY